MIFTFSLVWYDWPSQLSISGVKRVNLNPFNAETSYVQSTRTRTQRFLKTIYTLSCWYSLESFRRVLSDENPFARVSVIFRFFASFRNGQISLQQHKG